MIVVRFAPSPTGIPHIGNIRTALFNFLFARHNNGKFILRIEDTDRSRFIKEAEDAIYESLNWLDLIWDEKYVQSERLSIYRQHAQILKDKGIAYEDKGAIRFKMPKIGQTGWTDSVGQKEISFKNLTQEDFIIIKSDGFPTYNFANVIDDHLLRITHVIRGEEFISSTPKHIQLYKAFDWEIPVFAHLPVILERNRKKLSKRQGAKSVIDYKKEGYLKETILNFVVLLGWNPGKDKEKMTLEEMIKSFKLENVNSASPILDLKKLDWMNGVWIRNLSIDDLRKRLLDFYSKDKNVQKLLNDSESSVVIKAAASRMKTLKDFKELISKKTSERKLTEEENKVQKKLLDFLLNELGSENETWKNKKLLATLKKFSKNEKIPFKKIYFLLTGKEHGIGLLELNQIYGKDFFIKNLRTSKWTKILQG